MNGFISREQQQHITMQRKEHILFGYTARILVLKIFNVYFSYGDAFYFHFMDLEKARISVWNVLTWRLKDRLFSIRPVQKYAAYITGQQRGSKTNFKA